MATYVDVRYTINFNMNGGSGDTTPVTGIERDVELGAAFYVGFSRTASRSGYSFLGWSTSSGASSPSYGSSGNYTFVANSSSVGVTLYAVWRRLESYTVSFDANGGSNAPASMTRYSGTTDTLPMSVPERAGFAFVGWCRVDSGDGAVYGAGARYTWTKNEVLYAIWKAVGSTFTLSKSTLAMDNTDSCTVTITKSSSIVDHHTVRIELGSQELTIQNVALSTSFTIPLSWNSQVTDATSRVATVTVTSFKSDGSRHGDDVVDTIVLTVPSSVVPTAIVTLQSMGDAIAASWGVYIQGKSYVKIDVTAQSQYGATVSSISIIGKGIDASANDSSIEASSGVYAGAGSFDYTITISDSRGRMTTEVRTVEVHPYYKPVLVGFEAYRSDSSGQLDDIDGAYLTVKHSSVNAAVAEYNVCTVEYSYKIYRSSSAYTIITSNAQSQTNYIASADISKTYVVHAKVTDSFGEYTEIETRVESVECSLALGLNNDRARFGGPCRQAGLEVDWQTKFNSRITAPDHFQRGFVSARTVAAGTVDEVIVSFGSSFSLAPNVVATIYQSQSVGNVVLTIYGTTVSQFKLRIENNNAYDVSVGVIWIAIL